MDADLKRLESESIHIMREVAAEAVNPVLLYSAGKDSSVLVELARKAFHPAKIPFPLLHVDTSYKFEEMYSFRDKVAKRLGAKLVVRRNEEAIAKGANPWKLGTIECCAKLKTQGLLDALKEGAYDIAIGGARREEERSRAKERIFSFRDRHGQWDPKSQRPEFWDIYNARKREGESFRVFPLSNWTELDVWRYIDSEGIAVNELYFAKERLVVMRDGRPLPYEKSMPLKLGEKPCMMKVRFRTLGCYPLTGAIESNATNIEEIVEEMMTVTVSERTTRVIDFDQEASMEQKKREGYF